MAQEAEERSLRESAIGVSLPELASLLDRWRMPTVEVAALGVPPHITLLYPWRPAPLRDVDISEAEAAVRDFAPFSLALVRLERFPGVLYLAPAPDDILKALTRRLTAAFPDTPPYGGQFTDPTPHLTLAKADSEDALDVLEADVAAQLAGHLPVMLTIHHLTIEEEASDGTWATRATIPLAGSPSASRPATA
jgi:hypothetical protein